ncbi:hypothetical protein BGX34_001849, partial [Mortierella sp. NVP85]
SIFACAPGTTRGYGVHLDTDPKGESILYTNGKSVFIRNIENPHIATEYTQHAYNATVAKYAPSGYYIASGDERGNVRVWDTASGDQILKLETQALSGKVNDLAWDSESKRIIAVGDGQNKFAHAFMFDSGSTSGTIMGHSKAVNTVAIRQNRPFSVLTGGDDKALVVSTAFPVKYKTTIQDHERYIQEAKFSHDGEMFATVGSDGKIFLYTASTGEKIKEISAGQHGHTGTIFAFSWSADNRQILTSSADQTVKIWDVETSNAVTTFDLANADNKIFGQQVGNIWKNNHLLSLSLSGDLNYLDPSSSKVTRVVKGHQKSISALTTGIAEENRATFFTGDSDGRVFSWEPNTGVATSVSEEGRGITQMVSGGGQLVSMGVDDVRITNRNTPSDVSILSTDGQAKGVSSSDDGQIIVAATAKEVQVIQGGKKVDSIALEYNATAIAINPQRNLVAIGSEDKKVYVMDFAGTKLTARHTFSNNSGAITVLAFHPAGDQFAAGDTVGKVILYNAVSKETVAQNWVFHTARIASIGWSPSGRYAVSGSLDTNIYVWDSEAPSKRIGVIAAHKSGVTGTIFLDETTVVSAGADACVKTWKLKHH